jgi:hypothetical protein
VGSGEGEIPVPAAGGRSAASVRVNGLRWSFTRTSGKLARAEKRSPSLPPLPQNSQTKPQVVSVEEAAGSLGPTVRRRVLNKTYAPNISFVFADIRRQKIQIQV